MALRVVLHGPGIEAQLAVLPVALGSAAAVVLGSGWVTAVVLALSGVGDVPGPGTVWAAPFCPLPLLVDSGVALSSAKLPAQCAQSTRVHIAPKRASKAGILYMLALPTR